MRRFLTDVIVGGDTDAIEAFQTEDPSHHHLVFGGRGEDDGFIALGVRVLAGSEVELDLDDVVAADDAVAIRATVTGTHTASLFDLTPTGRSFEITYVWFFRIDNGRIAEIRSIPDGLGLLRDLGAIPDDSPNTSHTQSTNPRDHDS